MFNFDSLATLEAGRSLLGWAAHSVETPSLVLSNSGALPVAPGGSNSVGARGPSFLGMTTSPLADLIVITFFFLGGTKSAGSDLWGLINCCRGHHPPGCWSERIIG